MLLPVATAVAALLLRVAEGALSHTHAPSLRTPATGWNSWNTFACAVNETILQAQALAMVQTGLAAVGFSFINSDDCWQDAGRDAAGHLIPNAQKFPSGLPATVAYIHSLGLRAGLYTARGTRTCDGFAGACAHEASDAAWYAQQEIDYLKDDACSPCGNDSFLDSYGKMAAGLRATGRPIVLSIEGDADASVLTSGAYGQSKRIGHDISAHWRSMLSLVDIASGLWPFAHNGSAPGAVGPFCAWGRLSLALRQARRAPRAPRLRGWLWGLVTRSARFLTTPTSPPTPHTFRE